MKFSPRLLVGALFAASCQVAVRPAPADSPPPSPPERCNALIGDYSSPGVRHAGARLPSAARGRGGRTGERRTPSTGLRTARARWLPAVVCDEDVLGCDTRGQAHLRGESGRRFAAQSRRRGGSHLVRAGERQAGGDGEHVRRDDSSSRGGLSRWHFAAAVVPTAITARDGGPWLYCVSGRVVAFRLRGLAEIPNR